MKTAFLPVVKAVEPDEDARQPEIASSMTPILKGAEKTPHYITFADDTDIVTPPQSQKSSSYREALSQPVPGLSHRAKLQWLQKRRTSGLWAQCDECNKWRYLPKVLDSYELPKKWYCRLNPDHENADCSVPQVPIRVRDEEDLIYAEYSAGSVVWARMAGWPWWPAMVDDCPDTEQYYWIDGFSDIPTHYNVTFFDDQEVTRGWVSPENLKSFTTNKNAFIKPFLKNKKYKTRLAAAIEHANGAVKLPLKERLEKYSFVARYAGKINSPKTDKKKIKKQQALLKRKFKIPFGTFDSDDETDQPNTLKLVSDLKTILGTQKKQDKTGVSKRARRVPINETDETDAQTAPENAAGDKDMEKKTANADKNMLTKNTELEKSTELNTEADSNTETFKQPTSLAVQVGSNSANSLIIEESFDNDTSKTYVPEQESQLSTQLTVTPVPESEYKLVVNASSSSDDFEY